MDSILIIIQFSLNGWKVEGGGSPKCSNVFHDGSLLILLFVDKPPWILWSKKSFPVSIQEMKRTTVNKRLQLHSPRQPRGCDPATISCYSAASPTHSRGKMCQARHITMLLPSLVNSIHQSVGSIKKWNRSELRRDYWQGTWSLKFRYRTRRVVRSSSDPGVIIDPLTAAAAAVVARQTTQPRTAAVAARTVGRSADSTDTHCSLGRSWGCWHEFHAVFEYVFNMLKATHLVLRAASFSA